MAYRPNEAYNDLPHQETEKDVEGEFKADVEENGRVEGSALDQHIGHRHGDGEDEDDQAVHQHGGPENPFCKWPPRPKFFDDGVGGRGGSGHHDSRSHQRHCHYLDSRHVLHEGDGVGKQKIADHAEDEHGHHQSADDEKDTAPGSPQLFEM